MVVGRWDGMKRYVGGKQRWEDGYILGHLVAGGGIEVQL